MDNFTQFMVETQNQPSKEEIQIFVDNNFEAEGLEFQPWDPSDWIANPLFLSKINNTDLRTWGQQLHETWKSLGRQIKGVLCKPRFLTFFIHICVRTF